jgi:GxxExxY protein
VRFECQKEVKITYNNVEIGTHRLDLVVEDQIIIELKSAKELADLHFSQIRSYLKATGLKIGLLLNFGKPILEVKRVIN